MKEEREIRTLGVKNIVECLVTSLKDKIKFPNMSKLLSFGHLITYNSFCKFLDYSFNFSRQLYTRSFYTRHDS